MASRELFTTLQLLDRHQNFTALDTVPLDLLVRHLKAKSNWRRQRIDYVLSTVDEALLIRDPRNACGAAKPGGVEESLSLTSAISPPIGLGKIRHRLIEDANSILEDLTGDDDGDIENGEELGVYCSTETASTEESSDPVREAFGAGPVAGLATDQPRPGLPQGNSLASIPAHFADRTLSAHLDTRAIKRRARKAAHLLIVAGCLVILFSLVVSILWSWVKGDVSAGFTIGAYIVAAGTLLLIGIWNYIDLGKEGVEADPQVELI